MKIAIAHFGSRVSPRFDCAPEVLIVELAQGKAVEVDTVHVAGWTDQQRARELLRRNVEVLICGGLDTRTEANLRQAGIAVFGWIRGEAGDALRAWVGGSLTPGAAVSPETSGPAPEADQSEPSTHMHPR